MQTKKLLTISSAATGLHGVLQADPIANTQVEFASHQFFVTAVAFGFINDCDFVVDIDLDSI
jgi:hypothetical protein